MYDLLYIYHIYDSLCIYIAYIYTYIPGVPGGKVKFWEVKVLVILSKKVYMNMFGIPNYFRYRAV